MSDTPKPVGSGLRYNKGKIRYELIPTHLLADTARVLEFGANKYHAWNWAAGISYSSVIGCIKRHLSAIERGEDIDPESGFRHTGHLMGNILFLEHYMNMKGKGEAWDKLDDRPTEWFGVASTDSKTDDGEYHAMMDKLAAADEELAHFKREVFSLPTLDQIDATRKSND